MGTNIRQVREVHFGLNDGTLYYSPILNSLFQYTVMEYSFWIVLFQNILEILFPKTDPKYCFGIFFKILILINVISLFQKTYADALLNNDMENGKY